MRRITVIAVLLVPLPVVAAEAADLGPLFIRSQGPIQVLRLAPIPRSPYVPEPGENRLQTMFGLSSIYAKDESRYFLDFHVADLHLAVARGLRNGWAVEFGFNERRPIKTYLDNVTLEFHDLFGLDQNGRREVPMNDFRISIPDYDIELGSGDVKRFSRSLEATLMKNLVKDRPGLPDVGASLTVRHELLENRPVMDGSVDYGVALSFAQRFGHNAAFANVAYTYFGSERFLEAIPLRKQQWTGMLSYSWRTRTNQTLILQYLYSQGVVVDLGELSEGSHEVHLGYKWQFGRKTWELGLIENVYTFNNSPDAGITLGLSYDY